MPPPPTQSRSRRIQDYFKRADKDTAQVPAPIPAPAQHHSLVSNTPREPQLQVSSLPQTGVLAHPSPNPPSAAGPLNPTQGCSTQTPQSAHADRGAAVASQSSAHSGGSFSGGSKRVLSNGQPVVLNSDSETDSDDSEPLPELDWGLPPARAITTGPPTKIESGRKTRNQSLRQPPREENDGKASFSRFVQAAHENAAMERKITEAKIDLEKPLEEPALPNFDVNEETLKDVVNDEGDPEKVKRLYLAMQRTNALHMDCVFHFFPKDTSLAAKKTEFPMRSLPNHKWTSNFEDPPRRDQTFLTGFARHIFKHQELPEELASWLIDQLCVERNLILSAKYIELLESHEKFLASLLDVNKLNGLFKATGVNIECLDNDREVEPSYEAHSSTKRVLPASLKPIIQLLRTAASWLQPKTSSRALYILSHLCMDDSVIADADTLIAVQDAIEAIMCSIPDNSQLSSVLADFVPDLLARITHPILQQNLVRSLPIKSPLTAYFQRHLALAFLLHPEELEVRLGSPMVPSIIHTHLQSSRGFKVDRDTDYSSFAARLSLLDIAIGPGPNTVPYQPLSDTAMDQGDSSPITPPFPPSSEERAFNKEVDALAQHIRMLSNLIVEAGAIADLTRLDAKECSERLCHRLENAVRIGGRRPRNPFFQEQEAEQGKRFLNTWLGKSQSNTPTANGH